MNGAFGKSKKTVAWGIALQKEADELAIKNAQRWGKIQSNSEAWARDLMADLDKVEDFKMPVFRRRFL